jgi:predicted methyltransferase
MVKMMSLAAAVLAVGLMVGAAAAPPRPDGLQVAAAVADSASPAQDRARDELRRPAEVLAFAGVEPGMRVMDLIPGGGYYTRILARAVGPEGRVYALQPFEVVDELTSYRTVIEQLAAVPAYSNVVAMFDPVAGFRIDEPLDVVFTALNYHDVHADFMRPADAAAMNQAVFRALRPGGVFVVNDHHATAGSGVAEVNRVHRIDVEVVKREVLAAGFVLEAESGLLAHPEDDRTGHVYADAMRGRTDQFLLRFRKPG